METLPFDILAVFACLHSDEFRTALGFGSGKEKPDFSLRLKKPGLPFTHIAAIFGTMALTNVLPHVEELWRCWKAYREGRTGAECLNAPANYTRRSKIVI